MRAPASTPRSRWYVTVGTAKGRRRMRPRPEPSIAVCSRSSSCCCCCRFCCSWHCSDGVVRSFANARRKIGAVGASPPLCRPRRGHRRFLRPGRAARTTPPPCASIAGRERQHRRSLSASSGAVFVPLVVLVVFVGDRRWGRRQVGRRAAASCPPPGAGAAASEERVVQLGCGGDAAGVRELSLAFVLLLLHLGFVSSKHTIVNAHGVGCGSPIVCRL